jgi:hypothetical protein
VGTAIVHGGTPYDHLLLGFFFGDLDLGSCFGDL